MGNLWTYLILFLNLNFSTKIRRNIAVRPPSERLFVNDARIRLSLTPRKRRLRGIEKLQDLKNSKQLASVLL